TLALSPPLHSPPFPYTTLFRSAVATEWFDTGARNRAFAPLRTVAIGFGFDGSMHPPGPLPRRQRARGSTIAAEKPGALQHHTKADRKSTRLNSSHVSISYAVFC